MATSTSTSTSTSASTSAATSASPLSLQQKVKVGLDAQAQGNSCFTSGDIRGALRHYHTAVLYLSGLDQMGLGSMLGQIGGGGDDGDVSPVRENDAPETLHHKVHLSKVYSNMAACHIKLDNYPRAIDAADKADKADPFNAKASFRKAQALRLGGSLHQAIDVLQKAAERYPREKAAFAGELALCEKTLRAKEAQSRNMWKGFLSKKPRVLSGPESGQADGQGGTDA
ncbi:hypothetical protein ACQY0O_005708 [Thecaphora frezii]